MPALGATRHLRVDLGTAIWTLKGIIFHISIIA
jgi:hypothetical protein